MRPTVLRPRAQVFVCCHTRGPDDVLQSACGGNGPAVFDAVRAELARAGASREIWVTRTACLGHCPRTGCSVALYPANVQWAEVARGDAASIAAHALDVVRRA